MSKIKLIRIISSEQPTKRFKATFSDGTITHFGQKHGSTFIDHHDERLRAGYIARHSKNGENWNDWKSAGCLSRYILWEHTQFKVAVQSYKKRFGI
jgi:hypothetical protein